jgi:hypothetical protein
MLLRSCCPGTRRCSDDFRSGKQAPVYPSRLEPANQRARVNESTSWRHEAGYQEFLAPPLRPPQRLCTAREKQYLRQMKRALHKVRLRAKALIALLWYRRTAAA